MVKDNKMVCENKKYWSLFIATSSVNLLGFVAGTAYSWSSPVIPKLNGKINPEQNPFSRPITPFEESWIASLISFGAIFGPAIGGITIDKIGRKKTLIFSAIPMLISYLITGFATSVEYYYIGRFLLGFGIGFVYSLVPIYVGEISEDNNRGFFGCFLALFYTIGSVFCYGIGPYVSVQALSLIFLIPIIIFLITFTLFAPESPYYYVLVNKQEEAEGCLTKIRSNSIRKELLAITLYVNESQENKTNICDLFHSKIVVRSLIIGLALMFLQQFSGASIIVSYLQPIFEETGSNIPADISATIIGFIQFISNIFTSQLVERIGRKSLLLISIIGMFIAHMCLGLYFSVELFQQLYWLPIVSIILYIGTYNLGLGPISWVMLGELYSPEIKGLALTITITFCFISAFLTTFIFPFLIIFIGTASTYFLLACFCGLGILIIFSIVPETKGKSLREIQLLLERRK